MALLDVADDTLGYVARDLTGPDGGFFSAEDADSVIPDRAAEAAALTSEGAFYLWTATEVNTLLGADAEVVSCRYGIEPDGNAPHDPTGEFRGRNHLFVARAADEVARRTGRPIDDVTAIVNQARWTLAEARGHRPRPHLDDKVLAAWNGLMIAALARAAYVFDGEPRGAVALERAGRAAAFVRDRLWDSERRTLRRRYRGGQASIAGYAEDYAFLVWGLLELFQVDGDADWLRWALELQARQDELFWDEHDGGWFSTTGQDASVLLRMKEGHDGAEPSAGSISVLNLQTLFHLTGDRDVGRRIEQALARLGPRLGQAARVMPMMTAALSQYHAGTSQIVVVGEGGAADTRALRRCVAAHYLPFAVRVNVEAGPGQRALAELLPFIGAMGMVDRKATAYVCADFTCKKPVCDPEALDGQLTGLARRP